MLRAIDSLQLTAAQPVATPADRQPGDDVIIGLGVSDNEAAQRLYHSNSYRTSAVESHPRTVVSDGSARPG
ncbi:MAG: hypothetical protein ACSLE6_11585 [Mycobacterium sp.]